MLLVAWNRLFFPRLRAKSEKVTYVHSFLSSLCEKLVKQHTVRADVERPYIKQPTMLKLQVYLECLTLCKVKNQIKDCSDEHVTKPTYTSSRHSTVLALISSLISGHPMDESPVLIFHVVNHCQFKNHWLVTFYIAFTLNWQCATYLNFNILSWSKCWIHKIML